VCPESTPRQRTSDVEGVSGARISTEISPGTANDAAETAKLPRKFLRLKLAILFLLAPRLLDLLESSSSSFGNNLPDVDEARK
jgi:hypothetical protein